MMNATLTKDGAKRLNVPNLAGKTVQIDELIDNILANNVYYEGKRLGQMLSYVGDEKGLILEKSK